MTRSDRCPLEAVSSGNMKARSWRLPSDMIMTSTSAAFSTVLPLELKLKPEYFLSPTTTPPALEPPGRRVSSPTVTSAADACRAPRTEKPAARIATAASFLLALNMIALSLRVWNECRFASDAVGELSSYRDPVTAHRHCAMPP